jgi:hypothetical protein
MILAAAVLVGLAASLLRHRKRTLSRIAAIPLRSAWLLLLALALQLPLLREATASIQDLRVQQALFLLSYPLLLVFVWRSRRLGAILIVGLGIACNLAVVVANGGWMPITPEALTRINPGSVAEQWSTGTHYSYSKDIILAREDTRLGALSDALIAPPPFPWPTAFSVGDLVVALGVVFLLLAPDWVVERRNRREP